MKTFHWKSYSERRMKEFDRTILSCVWTAWMPWFSISVLILINVTQYRSEFCLIFLHPFIPYPIPQLRTLANRRCKQPVFIPPSKCPRVSSFSELQWRSHRAPIDCLRLLLGSLFANHSSNLDQLFQELVSVRFCCEKMLYLFLITCFTALQ